MKNFFRKPGFEFMFALSLILIICLPPLVFAQNNRSLEIRINNGDTVVNGRNIKDLSAADRQQAMKDIDNLGKMNMPRADRNVIVERRSFNIRPGDSAMAGRFRFNDSIRHSFKLRLNHLKGEHDSVMTFNYRMDGPDNTFDERRFDERRMNDREFVFRRGMDMEFVGRRNTQSFNYTNTGTDGISTHISFRVNDASPEKTKKMTGAEKSDLDIKDLNLVPEFSSGKTLLMFSLPAKTAAEVNLTDNEGKLIWSDKAINGSFNKSFAIGLNGVYYLEVKQAGKVVLKRIIKEE